MDELHAFAEERTAALAVTEPRDAEHDESDTFALECVRTTACERERTLRAVAELPGFRPDAFSPLKSAGANKLAVK